MSAHIAIVDDDADVRDSLQTLLDIHGFECTLFPSGDAFLDGRAIGVSPAGDYECVLMDIRMPGRDGLQTLGEYVTRSTHRPVIMMSGHADVPIAVEAMRIGALNFIEKPFHAKVLLATLSEALKIARSTPDASRLAVLTKREREVAELICDGQLNKQIAHTLGISVRTVEAHRAKLMTKLDVRSVPALVMLVKSAA